MKLKIAILFAIITSLTLNSCLMFSSYSVDGEIKVKSYWVDSLNDVSGFELINTDSGSNYYAIEIEYDVTDYEVEFGRKLEDYSCEINLEFPPYIFNKVVRFEKNSKGQYLLKLNTVTSIEDKDMYTVFFCNDYSIRIYDASKFTFGNRVYIFPKDEYSGGNTFSFTYPDGTSPEDWRVYDNE